MEAIQRNGSPNRKAQTTTKATGFPVLSGGRVFASLRRSFRRAFRTVFRRWYAVPLGYPLSANHA